MLTFTQFGVILFTQYCVIAFYTVLCNFPVVALNQNSHICIDRKVYIDDDDGDGFYDDCDEVVSLVKSSLRNEAPLKAHCDTVTMQRKAAHKYKQTNSTIIQ